MTNIFDEIKDLQKRKKIKKRWIKLPMIVNIMLCYYIYLLSWDHYELLWAYEFLQFVDYMHVTSSALNLIICHHRWLLKRIKVFKVWVIVNSHTQLVSHVSYLLVSFDIILNIIHQIFLAPFCFQWIWNILEQFNLFDI